MDEDIEREYQLTAWNYSHVQDHFKGLLEALEDSKIDAVLDHIEEMAAALDIEVNLDKIHDEFFAL